MGSAMRLRSRVAFFRDNVDALPRSRREVLQSFQVLSGLRRQGWQVSGADGKPQTLEGESLPWMTYPIIEFLDRILTKDVRVLEFGSGGSTTWLAKRVGFVKSIEHDPQWYEMVAAQCPENAQIHLQTSDADWYFDPHGSYVQSGEDGAPWDVVIIDGLGRNDCARAADRLVHQKGLVVLDDIHNPLLAPAQEDLRSSGFGRIDFWGLRPGSGYYGGSSVFSKDFNKWLVPAV